MSAYTHLITAGQLQALQAAHAPLLVFDCSFDLANPEKADADFNHVRIPGAVQAHLDRDLSAHDSARAINGGRHPLPKREVFAQYLGRAGLRPGMQAVVYDRNGSSFCPRLWWMLKWAGHDKAAVLDGGLSAWRDANRPCEHGAPQASAAEAPPYPLGEPLRRLVMLDDVLGQLGQGTQTIVDARAAPRYRGEVEPLDAVAGHIPGALNRPFADNFQPDGRFKHPGQLRTEWLALLDKRAPEGVVHQCGSGVTALPNLLALEIAGFAPAALYAGGWSEWSRQSHTPKASGAESTMR